MAMFHVSRALRLGIHRIADRNWLFSSHSSILTYSYKGIATQASFSTKAPSLIKKVTERCRSGTLKLDEAIGLFKALIQLRRKPSGSAFDPLLQVMSTQMKHYAAVFHLSRVMNLFQIQPSVVTLNILIECCCRLGRLDLGFSVLGKMVKIGISPNSSTLSTLLTWVVEDSCRKRLEDRRDGRNVLIESAISAASLAANCGDSHKELVTRGEVCQVLKGEGIQASILKYTCLVRSLFVSYGMKGHPSFTDTQAAIVIDALVQQGMITEAQKLLLFKAGEDTSLAGRGWHKPLVDQRWISEACEILKIMSHIEQGIPALSTYTCFFHGLFMASNSKEAMELVKEMTAHKSFPEAFAVYTVLVDAFCKEGMMYQVQKLLEILITKERVAEAHKLLSWIIERGHKPTEATYHVLVDIYRLLGQTKEEDMVSSCLAARATEVSPPTTYSNTGLIADMDLYCTLLEGMCKMQNFSKANILLQSLQGIGLQPTVRMYNLLLSAYCRVGMWDEITSILQQMDDEKIAIDDSILTTLLSGSLDHLSHLRQAIQTLFPLRLMAWDFKPAPEIRKQYIDEMKNTFDHFLLEQFA